MPASLAPGKDIYLVADQNTGATGQILIQADGSVQIHGDPDHPSDGEVFTSLDGVTYVPGG